MTTEQKEKPLRPLPTPSAENKLFWDGLKQHELRIPRCKSCGAYHWLPKGVCPNCLSTDLEWAKVSGEGTVWTYTTVYRAGPAYDPPFTAAAIELKEQPVKCLLLSWIANCKLEDIKVGMPVKITYQDIPGEDLTIYAFEPA